MNNSKRKILPKGTIVKHGTVSSNLESILNHGLIPGFNRHPIRKKFEPEPVITESVYVAQDIIAYYSSYISFNSCMVAFALKPNKPLAIPIVLNIRLEENCPIIADEDYVCQKPNKEILLQHAKSSWEDYGSGGIIRNEGICIPSSWISSFEFPLLKHPNSKKIRRTLTRDVMMMILGCQQQVEKHSKQDPKHYKKELEKEEIETVGFSQKLSFNEISIHRFCQFNILENKNALKKYAYTLFDAFEYRARKRNLPLKEFKNTDFTENA